MAQSCLFWQNFCLSLLISMHFSITKPAVWHENAYILDYIIMPAFWQQIAYMVASKCLGFGRPQTDYIWGQKTDIVAVGSRMPNSAFWHCSM
jgi:hypothetical protein